MNNSRVIVRFMVFIVVDDIINRVTVRFADLPHRGPACMGNSGLINTGEGDKRLKNTVILNLFP